MKLNRISVVLVVLCVVTPPLSADDAVKFPVTVGVDYASQYYFRGIPQENQDWIVQPFATIGISVPQTFGPFSNPTFSIGSWNSIHGGPTGEGSDPRTWYEADYIGTLSAGIAQNTTLALAYTAYTSPNDSYNTFQEISLAINYDEPIVNQFAWHGHALVAAEIDDQADAGNSLFVSRDTSRGVYLELGFAPEFALTDQADAWRLSVPVNVGLSLHDYYERADGGDRVFGYCDVGADLIIPLTFMKFGTWTVHGGPHIIWLGDNTSRIGEPITGGNQDIQFYGKVGISASF